MPHNTGDGHGQECHFDDILLENDIAKSSLLTMADTIHGRTNTKSVTEGRNRILGVTQFRQQIHHRLADITNLVSPP